MKLIIRWLCIALAVALAVWIVPGIGVHDGASMWWTLLVVAAVLGLVNATVGIALKFISLPLMIMTLGLFGIIINALMLQFASWISNGVFRTGFYVDGFWPALWASLIISIVSALLWGILGGDEKKSCERR